MGTLTAAQKYTLRNGYFTPKEIHDFNHAKAGDTVSGHTVTQDVAFNSKPFLAMRKSRIRWATDLIRRGWTKREISERITRYYGRKSGRSPWDFLKLEYSPVKTLTDFADAVRRKIRSRVSSTMGGIYGRRLRPSLRPKFIPRHHLRPKRHRR